MAVRLSSMCTGCPLLPQEDSWYSFLLRGWVNPGALVLLEGYQLKKSNDLIGNRTRDLQDCSIVPQPTTLPLAPRAWLVKLKTKLRGRSPQANSKYKEVINSSGPITVAARSRAWNVFARSNTGIVHSNPPEGMDVCVHYVFALGSGLALGWSPVRGVLPTL
jgi:hypothetical protein